TWSTTWRTTSPSWSNIASPMARCAAWSTAKAPRARFPPGIRMCRRPIARSGSRCWCRETWVARRSCWWAAKGRCATPSARPADAYGRSLPRLTINLIVADVERSLAWYRRVLRAEVRYGDPDFAALRIGGTECMLHADHAYESHPWAKAIAARHARGLGAELR